MQSMRFETSDEGNAAVAKHKISWKRVSTQFSYLADYWQDITKTYLKEVLTISQNDASPLTLTGKCLDKDFTIKLASTMVGIQLMGKVITLTSDPVTGENRQAWSFILSPEGNVLNVAGEILMSNDDHEAPNYRLTCAMIEAIAAA